MSEIDYDKLMERLAGELQDLSRSSLEENIRKGADIKAELRALKDHPGFKLFTAALQKQCDARVEEVCKTRPGLDGAIQNTHSIGEIAGIKLSLSFADTMIETADEAIRMNEMLLSNMPEEEEDNNG